MAEYREQRIIRRLFVSLLPVQALSAGLPAINTLLDGLIVGNCLGSTALAAIGFVAPMNNLLSAISSILATGSQLLCGRSLGKGNRKEIHIIFSTTLLLSFFFGFLFSAATVLFPYQLAALLGAGTDCLEYTAAYIRGIGYGHVSTLLLACLLPFLQLERQGRATTAAITVMVVSNIGGNLLNALVWNGGVFGAGLATAVSNILAVGVAVTSLLFKSELYRFSPKLFSFKSIARIAENGFPGAISPGLRIIRSYLTNQFVFMLGGTVAMSAMSVAENISLALGKTIESGYSGSCRMIASILVGQRDTSSLRDLHKSMFRSAWFLYAGAYAVVFFFAKPLSLLFGAAPEHMAVYVTVIRLQNLWYLTSCFKAPPQGIYQAMKQMKEVTIGLLINLALVPVAVCYLFAKRLGLPVVVSMPFIGEVMTLLFYVAVFTVKAHRLPRSPFELCYIPNTISASRENRFKAVIHTADDVTAVSQQVIEFCKGRGLDARKSYYCGLAVEEMAIFTVTHGFEHRDATIDLRIIYEDGHISMLLRDDSKKFNPVEWLELCAPEEQFRSTGIRMVRNLSTEMQYTSTLGLNVLMIKI